MPIRIIYFLLGTGMVSDPEELVRNLIVVPVTFLAGNNTSQDSSIPFYNMTGTCPSSSRVRQRAARFTSAAISCILDAENIRSGVS
jgi:hypothetical protein